MDESKTCAICLDELKDPRVLPCWHGACMGCIKQMPTTAEGSLITCHMCREVCLNENIDSLPKPVTCELCKNFVVIPLVFPCCEGLCCKECLRKAAIDGVVSCPYKCEWAPPFQLRQLPNARICPECFVFHPGDGHGCGHYLCPECIIKYEIHEVAEKKKCCICGIRTNNALRTRPFSADDSGYRNSHQETSELLHLLSQLPALYRQITMRQCFEKFWKIALKLLCLLLVEAVMVFVYGFCVKTWVAATVTILTLRFDVILCVLACVVTNAVLTVFSFYYFSHATVIFFVTLSVSDWAIPPKKILTRLSSQLLLVLVLSLFGAPIFLHKAILELIINILLLMSIKDVFIPYELRPIVRLP